MAMLCAKMTKQSIVHIATPHSQRHDGQYPCPSCVPDTFLQTLLYILALVNDP